MATGLDPKLIMRQPGAGQASDAAPPSPTPELVGAKLNELFKGKDFQLRVTNKEGVYWYQLVHANFPDGVDLIPFNDVGQIQYLKNGITLALPYLMLPYTEGGQLKLREFPIGLGTQLHLYIPFDDRGDFMSKTDLVKMDYGEDPLQTTIQAPFSFNILSYSDVKYTLPIFVLSPPRFDYRKAIAFYMKGGKVTFEPGETRVKDICVVVDDSGSMSRYYPETMVQQFLNPNLSPLGNVMRFADAYNFHLVSSTSGKVEHRFSISPNDLREDRFDNKLVDGLKSFWQPKGEAEELSLGQDVCGAVLGWQLAEEKQTKIPPIIIATDSESELPPKASREKRVMFFQQVNGKSPHIELGARYKLPLALAEKLFDASLSTVFPVSRVKTKKIPDKEINALTTSINTALRDNDTKALQHLRNFRESLHVIPRGEEKMRRLLPLLLLASEEEVQQEIPWVGQMISDKYHDYPLKSRAVFIIASLGLKGYVDSFSILLKLKEQIDDPRLRHDISIALSFSSRLERARRLWEIAQIDPNGVDLAEVRNCGLNEYTVKILAHVINEGMVDRKKEALDILDAFLMNTNAVKFDEELQKLPFDQLVALYWNPEHIVKIKEALAKAQAIFLPNTTMYRHFASSMKALDGATRALAKHVTWEEQTEFKTNLVNMPHYYVPTDITSCQRGVQNLRKRSVTEEAFLYVKTDEGEEICFEYGDSEQLGSVRPLSPHIMSEVIKDTLRGKPVQMVNKHIHPGRPDGVFGVADHPSHADILSSISEWLDYDERYDGPSYHAEIETPNGTLRFVSKHGPDYLTRAFYDPTSTLWQVIKEYLRYLDKAMKGKVSPSEQTMQDILDPIVEVTFTPNSQPAGGAK